MRTLRSEKEVCWMEMGRVFIRILYSPSLNAKDLVKGSSVSLGDLGDSVVIV